MSFAQFLPSIPGLAYIRSEFVSSCTIIYACSTQLEACCPLCGTISTKSHSYYTRKPQDLTWVGREFRLILTVRRFFCKEKSCPRKIFVERFGEVLPVYARKTGRMLQLIEILGFSLGGKAGAWVAQQIGMEISADTVIRILLKKPDQEFPTPKVLGIDDWSRRKGRTYGTILVDLEKQRPIDLLPDREADTLTQWLKDHPGVEIISRDRASAYSAGAEAGAPDAIQVADRWHLLKNVRELFQKIFEANRQVLTQVCEQFEPIEKEESIEEPPDKVMKTDKQEKKEELTAEKEIISKEQGNPKYQQEINYDKVKRLYAQKMKVSKIAREVGISRGTVYKYINADIFPEKSPKICLITPYLPFLNKKIRAGLTKVELWQEVVKLGYKGGYRGFCHIMCQYYPEGIEGKAVINSKPNYLKQYSPRRLSYLLIKKKDKQTDADNQFFQHLYESAPSIKQSVKLTLEYCEMIREKKGDQFDDWLTRAENSDMTQIVNFAAGIRSDYEAVKNACTIEWSNGQVEGQVNRLKMIKRQMYGRAGFQLLRKRVIHTPRPG